MSISFDSKTATFFLETKNTQYVFSVFKEKYLAHRYYGKKEKKLQLESVNELQCFSPYPEEAPEYSANDYPSEISFFGTGDFRPSTLKIRSQNGDANTAFVYSGYEITPGRVDIPHLPFAKAESSTQTLSVFMDDEVTGCRLTLYYTVYDNRDVISRYFSVENKGKHTVKIERAMSVCLDLPRMDFDMITLYGGYAKEMNVQRAPLHYGRQGVGSRRSSSSHYFNPFMALVDHNATEEKGSVYAFNFMYSGSFSNEVEVDFYKKTRVTLGLGEENFAYTLYPDESFYAPEAFMLYTHKGLGDMSRKMHAFVRNTIVRKPPFERRPIVLNTWEACYFNIDAKLLNDFATEAVRYGVDMIVMDDGWFGKRYNDGAGLGDWFVNAERFPDGLAPFVQGIKEKGIRFGIWIEPEMVNPDSNLYRTHPEWCLQTKGRKPHLSRNQLVLDMSNPEVLSYLKESFLKVFDGVDIDYIKWDYNRNISDAASAWLPKERQDEVYFRNMLGVYELYEWFTQKFPNVMIENCSGGGGRYDLGMMKYSSMIWTSDNTSPKDRVYIQNGALLAYPAIVMSCHVSKPKAMENWAADTDYKYKVAMGGMLGYELNILQMPKEYKREMERQIAFYREIRHLIEQGDLYRLITPDKEKGTAAYYYTQSSDLEGKAGDTILLSYLQNETSDKKKARKLPVKVADEKATYLEKISGKVYLGKELKKGVEVLPYAEGEKGQIWLFEKQEN